MIRFETKLQRIELTMNVIQQIDAEHMAEISAKRDLPEFSPGDTVRVNVRVSEGARTRLQAYEGLCIARSGGGIRESFTVRKISYGEGVERVFPFYSPIIEGVEVIRRGKVRRAKLYYLRDRQGKSARIPEATNVRAKRLNEEQKSIATKAPKGKAKKSSKSEEDIKETEVIENEAIDVVTQENASSEVVENEVIETVATETEVENTVTEVTETETEAEKIEAKDAVVETENESTDETAVEAESENKDAEEITTEAEAENAETDEKKDK